jgi:hypothetical protein
MNARTSDVRSSMPDLREPTRLDEGEPYAPAFRTELRMHAFRGPRVNFVPSIQAGERIYRLRGTFVIHLEYQDDGSVHAVHPTLPLFGFGRSIDEAMADFNDYFDAQYRDLVESDEALLADDALVVRRRLLAVVESIQDVPPTDAA